MINEFIKGLKEIDVPIFKVIEYGFVFSSLICLIGILLLATYNAYPVSYLFFSCGYLIVKSGLTFGAWFLVCGFVTDKLKKGII